MIMGKPRESVIGLGVVLLGLPVYHIVFTNLKHRNLSAAMVHPGEATSSSAGVETT
jgi:hypothetical protein